MPDHLCLYPHTSLLESTALHPARLGHSGAGAIAPSYYKRGDQEAPYITEAQAEKLTRLLNGGGEHVSEVRQSKMPGPHPPEGVPTAITFMALVN